MQRLFWLGLFGFLSLSSASANGIIEKIEEHIFFENFDSAAVLLQKVDATDYTRLLQRVVDGKANYADYYELLKKGGSPRLMRDGHCFRFSDKYIQEPSAAQPIELDYVRIQWNRITWLRNARDLDASTERNEALKRYINSHSDTMSREWKQARIYANTHDIVLALIQNNIEEGAARCKADERTAIAIRDTVLWITSKYYYSNFLMSMGQLDAYIQNTEEALALEHQLPKKTDQYMHLIENLLDALIYKGDYDGQRVESLLDSLYQSPLYHVYSFSFYAKYLASLPPGSEGMQRVLQRFQVPDLPTFCDTIVSQMGTEGNLQERYYLMMECANALFIHQYYPQAFQYKENCVLLTREIYTEDLAQSLADYKTLTIQQEKEAEVRSEKQKRQFFTILASVVGFFLLVSIYLMIKLNQKSKRLEISNKEKELLLKEIHHRVKNNFQLVISFMRLQEKVQSKMSLSDFIHQLERKLNSMAMVHEMLYKDSDTENLPLNAYLSELGDYIIQSLANNSDADVSLSVEGDAIKTTIDKAISIGLVLNEIITNSIKYAEREDLDIRIRLADGQSFFMLSVGDNGQGFPADFNPEQTSSLGTKVVLLLMNQINAKVSWKNDGGAQWFFSIPL